MSETHKVQTDALATLGTILTEGGRDAIHLAVEPVIAGEKIWPGQDIGLKDGKAYNQAAKYGIRYVGIADPFLKEAIMPNQMFWLIVYPRTITSLRHVWEHPDFTVSEIHPISNDEILNRYQKTEETIKTSEEWLEDWCASHDCPKWPIVKRILTAGQEGKRLDDPDYGQEYSIDGSYLTFFGIDAHQEVPREFWDHAEVVLGKMPHRPKYFTCSC